MKKWFVLALIACVAVAVQAGEGKKKGQEKGQGKDISKEKYIANQKKMAEKKGIEFDQAKVEKHFDRMDANKDGKLSPDEKPQRGKKGKGKDDKKGKETGKKNAE